MSDGETVSDDLMSEVERLAKEAAGEVESLAAKFEATWASSISEWKELAETRHGCWCGPGNICDEDKDAVDSCCHQHDLAYDTLGFDQDTMWTIDAMKATLQADQQLVECVTAAEAEDTETAVYREALLIVMGGRIKVAEWLEQHGY
jgi:hypothetical protein